MSVAIYPGSFDPITNGHIGVIRNGLVAFERLIVAVLNNPSKSPLFSVAERRELIQASVPEVADRIEVDTFDGLLVDYVRKRGARVVLRGLRAVADFEYEMQMANINRHLEPQIETVFVMAQDTYFYVSSHAVKEAALLGGDVSRLVPPPVAQRLSERVAAQHATKP